MRVVVKITKLALVIYLGLYSGVLAFTQKKCVELDFVHPVVTYDLKQYCWSVYNAQEITAPLDKLQIYVLQHRPPTNQNSN